MRPSSGNIYLEKSIPLHTFVDDFSAVSYFIFLYFSCRAAIVSVMCNIFIMSVNRPLCPFERAHFFFVFLASIDSFRAPFPIPRRRILVTFFPQAQAGLCSGKSLASYSGGVQPRFRLSRLRFLVDFFSPSMQIQE
jgi:hypothetical protein